MSKFDSPAYGFDTREQVKDHLNGLDGFDVLAYKYGTQNGIALSTDHGIGRYEFSQIRKVGYRVSFVDEVNDELVIEPAGDN